MGRGSASPPPTDGPHQPVSATRPAPRGASSVDETHQSAPAPQPIGRYVPVSRVYARRAPRQSSPHGARSEADMPGSSMVSPSPSPTRVPAEDLVGIGGSPASGSPGSTAQERQQAGSSMAETAPDAATQPRTRLQRGVIQW